MKTLLRLLQRFYNWALCYRDSTRSVGLIRIGLVLLIWSRWGGELILCRDIRLSAILLNSAFFLLTGLMCVGLWTRISSMGTAILLSILFIMHPSWKHHHTFLLVMSTLFIALTPCGRSYSLDRWLALRRALKSGVPPPPEIGNLWGLRLIAIQLSMVYFWTACEKLYWGFLSGERMELLAYNYYAGIDYANIPGFSALCFVIAITYCDTGIPTILRAIHPQTSQILDACRNWLTYPFLRLIAHPYFYFDYDSFVPCVHSSDFRASLH